MFTYSPQDKIILEFIKKKTFKSLHILLMLLPEWSTAVLFILFFYSFVTITVDSNANWCSRRKKTCIKSQGII